MACFNFGDANDFNIFLLGNHTQSNVDSEGRVAVAGNASYNNYGIGSALPLSLTRADLIVGGNMNIIVGTNFSGNSVISPTGTVIQYTMTNNNGVPGQPLVGSPINFAADQIYLNCASLAWGALTPTGTVTVNFGQLVLTGFDPVLNIFNYDAENIAGTGFTMETLNGINIVAPIGSTILINISGNNTGFGSYQIFRNGLTATGADGQFIVWNFYQALNLFNMNLSIKGSILAPLAQWWAVGFGNVEGTFIANNLVNTMGTLEAHNFPFLGCLPDVCSATTSSTTTSTTSTTTSTTSTSTSTTSTTTSTTSTSTSTTSTTTSTTSTSTSTTSTTTSTTSTASTTTSDPRQAVINLLLASIAAEETALANILNAEGEKIQSIIGTLPGQLINNPTLAELLEVNSSVNTTINSVIRKEMLLLYKLCEVIKII